MRWGIVALVATATLIAFPPRPGAVVRGRRDHLPRAGAGGTGSRARSRGGGSRGAGPPAAGLPNAATLWVVAAGAGLGVALVVGGRIGSVAAIPVALGLRWWLSRLEPSAVRARQERVARDVPLVVDLLAAVAASGVPTVAALDEVAEAVGGDVRADLHDVVRALRLGADPARAWAAFTASSDPGCRALGRAMVISHRTGTPVVPVLERLATDVRDAARGTALVRVRAVGAKAAAPLGLCFLPAFVVVGIVPLVISVGSLVLP